VPEHRAAYRSGIDAILRTLALAAELDQPLMTLVAGSALGVGASSTALSLAYRAANTGTRTLLIDACSTDAHLSHRLARSLVQSRPCVLDSEEHLAEITMNDARTGLSLLPLAFTDLARFDSQQQDRLLAGLRKLARRYELVLVDVGTTADNPGATFLGVLTERLLIVAPNDETSEHLLGTAASLGVPADLTSIVTTSL
jgi:Mrp family chromosome partitioning ATPase